MYIAKAEDHAACLQQFIETMKKYSELSALFTPDLEDYSNNFVTKTLCGEFKEISDVTMFVSLCITDCEVPSAQKISARK